MLPDSTRQLVLKLWDLTRRGAIHWRKSPNGEQVFETEGYVVALQATPPRLRILRHDGQVIEEASTESLASARWPMPDLKRFDEAVFEMARRADQVSNGAEVAAQSVLSSLSAPPRARPASSPSTIPANTSSETAPSVLFGKTISFDLSAPRPPRAPPQAPASPATNDQPATHNVYSPWNS